MLQTSMGGILEIGFFFWLGAAAATIAVMAVFAAACMISNGRLPEQDIPYWQGLLIYLPTEAVPAAVFALTAAISSATEIFPLIRATGLGLVSLVSAGAIQVFIMAITLSRYDDNQKEKKEKRLLVQEQRPGIIFRLATSIPFLVFFVLPIVLYVSLQLPSVLA